MNRVVLFFTFVVLAFPVTIQAKPDIYVTHGHTLDGYARSKVQNKTIKDLACTMAIDGHKIKYVLPARETSLWYTANKKTYNHTHFSAWCGYLTLYPKFEKYRRR